MNVVQCRFEQTSACRTTIVTGWVQPTRGLKVGSFVVLEDEDGEWEITSMSAPIPERRIRRRWNNNV